MGILKGIIKTAKDLYNADANDKLVEYVGEKISDVVKKYDGTAEEEFETQKEKIRNQILDELNYEEFDNEYCQTLIDRFLNEYALSDDDYISAFYLKFKAWENVFYSISEIIRQDDFSSRTDEEREEFYEKGDEANEKCLENLDRALDFISEESEEESNWYCAILYSKSQRLHFRGEHVEAVRLAIRALPYACNDDERYNAKQCITGKVGQGCNYIIEQGGYGIYGIDIDKRIEICKSQNLWNDDDFKDESIEYKEGMLSFIAMCFIEEIDDIKNGQATFCNRPYHDRQFIFTVRDLDHIGGCYDDTDNIKYVFSLDELPGEITFPVGHPQANTLYYAHPLRPMYLPFENAQLLLFYEKVHEICRLFQCLGATHITARCIKGNKISQSVFSTYDTDAGAGYGIMDASGRLKGSNSIAGNKETKDEMFLEQTFSPKDAPYCPNDLVWATEDGELRTLIKQRLEGGLLTFTKRVSSYETSNLSSNQINDVKVAFQNMMLNVSANYSVSSDRTFSNISETEWEISVQFKPLDEFENYVSPNELKAKSDAKKGDLIMEVSKFIYMSGIGFVILDELKSDIKLGDKVVVSDNGNDFDSSVENIIVSFNKQDSAKAGNEIGLVLTGVNERNIQRGTMIYKKRELCDLKTEKTVKDNVFNNENEDNKILLTAEEEKYKDEILFCLEDNGIITEDDRKFLERKRKKFNISEDRAKEIERELIPSLNEDEKEYLETFKEFSSTTITDRIRRLLERERESLNISKERAEEIEKMVNK